MKWLWAFLGVATGLLGWFFRGVLASSKEKQLTLERDNAQAVAVKQSVKAEASRQELVINAQQQRKEDKINAADNSTIATQLDSLFK